MDDGRMRSLPQGRTTSGRSSVVRRRWSVVQWLRWFSDPSSTHRVFNLGAWGYDVITGQASWRASAGRMTRWLAARPGARVLDLGAGPGNSALAMRAVRPDARYVLLDRAPAMAARARRAVGGQSDMAVLVGDAVALPFPPGAFDLVTGHSFLYLLPDRPAALAEARRTLRPGGWTVFLEPRAGELGRAEWLRLARGGARFLVSMVGWRVFSGLHGRFTPDTLRQTLETAGFRETYAETAFEGAGVMGAGKKGEEGETRE